MIKWPTFFGGRFPLLLCGAYGRSGTTRYSKETGPEARSCSIPSHLLVVVLGQMAAAFTQINKYIEAIGDCTKSIEIDPNYSKAYSRLGLVYYAQGNYRDALEKGFLKALQLDPDNESVKENIRMAEQKLRDAHRAGQHQNGRSTNHSNQEPTNGQASGGPRNWNVPGMPFNFVDFSPGVANVFMNMAGQTPQERTNDGSETGRSDNEPEIRIGGNVNFNIGEEVPEEFLGTLRSMMGMFSGAQPHQNPEGDMNRDPSPS